MLGGEAIGCYFANAPGAGDGSRLVLNHRLQLREQPGRCDKIVDGMDPNDAELLACGTEYAIVADKRSGVSPGGLGGDLAGPDLQYDDGLAGGQSATCGGRQRLRIARRLEAQSNDLRDGIIDHEVDAARREKLTFA
jgi:hypothetical protein